MSDPDERWMRQALELAADGMARGEMPIAAVVVVGGELVAGEAHTEERTQGRLLVHADLLALDRADRSGAMRGRRAESTLYVTLEPCLMCLGAAFTSKVGDVVFALESPTDGGVEAFAHWDRLGARTACPRIDSPPCGAACFAGSRRRCSAPTPTSTRRPAGPETGPRTSPPSAAVERGLRDTGWRSEPAG